MGCCVIIDLVAGILEKRSLIALWGCSVPRYAITVWYFDAKERAAAKDKYQLGTCFPFGISSLKLFLFRVPHQPSSYLIHLVSLLLNPATSVHLP